MNELENKIYLREEKLKQLELERIRVLREMMVLENAKCALRAVEAEGL